jgi:hypothetical protein
MRVKAESSASINDGSNAQRSVEIDTTGGVKTEPSIGDDVLTAQIAIRSSGKGSPFETIIGGVKAEPSESGRHHRELQESSMSMDMPSSLYDIPLDDDDDDDDDTQQGGPKIYEYYTYTAMVSISDDETVYAYTVSIADNDASITSRLSGAPEVGEEDATLYFTMNELTCDVNAQESHSFMAGKYQAWEASNPQTPVGKRVCWAAPPGHIINEGNPTMHKLIIQLFHHIENDWYDDSSINTIDRPATVYKLKYDRNTELQVLDEDETYVYYKTRMYFSGYDGSGSGSAEDVIEEASAVGYRCTEVRMEFADFQIFTGPDEVPVSSWIKKG